MATPITEHTIPDILRYANSSQVLSQLKISQQSFFRGGAISPDYSRTIYMVKSGVAFLYAASPNYSTLRQSAEYLFALCRPFGPLVPPATIQITNPSNQSTVVGGSATFCVTVTVSTGAPYTVQWFKNGIAIPGATSPCYTQTNAQLTDNGSLYNAVAMTVGLTQAVSATATITVTSPTITGYFAYMSTDPFPTLQGHSDPFVYQVSFPIVNIGETDITMPSASSPNQYLIVKVPTSVNIFNTWKNGLFDGGTLGLTGDFDWQGYLQFGGFTYYASRQALSFDTTQVLQFIP